MKKISLQWRMTLMTALLIVVTCVTLNFLLYGSGVYYLDSILEFFQSSDMEIEVPASVFSPTFQGAEEQVVVLVTTVQARYRATTWILTAIVTLLGSIVAYFVSGRALKPLCGFAEQVEQVQTSNLSEVRIEEAKITEFAQLSRTFNEMLERLQHGFDLQRQFTGNAAHELRTPLALMQVRLELFLKEHPDVPSETAEFLDSLQEQVNRLTRLSKTLLEMSDLQSVPRTDFIQLSPMVEEILTDLSPLAERKQVFLSFLGDAALVGSDPLIYRAIFNLVENAIKYNRTGGVVKVVISQENGEAVLLFQDSGCGIPAEAQADVFHPFFRVDKSRGREMGGAGLGLAMVWEIVRLHGGNIQVTESSDAGTTIELRLPAAEAQPS